VVQVFGWLAVAIGVGIILCWLFVLAYFALSAGGRLAHRFDRFFDERHEH